MERRKRNPLVPRIFVSLYSHEKRTSTTTGTKRTQGRYNSAIFIAFRVLQEGMNGYLENSPEASQNDTEFTLFSSVSGCRKAP